MSSYMEIDVCESMSKYYSEDVIMDMLAERGKLNIQKLYGKYMRRYLESIGFDYPEEGEEYRLVTEYYEVVVKVERVYKYVPQVFAKSIHIHALVSDKKIINKNKHKLYLRSGYSIWLGKRSGGNMVDKYGPEILDFKKV